MQQPQLFYGCNHCATHLTKNVLRNVTQTHDTGQLRHKKEFSLLRRLCHKFSKLKRFNYVTQNPISQKSHDRDLGLGLGLGKLRHATLTQILGLGHVIAAA